MTPTPSVVVVGAGGNIGSHLVRHLARMAGLQGLTLIDCDRYEASNLASQDISSRDLGNSKALVQARRARSINHSLDVSGISQPVEHVPLARLRASVILACLDSRRARQVVNQAAWRLGVPWIDAGVDGGGLLARVNVYRPGPDTSCLECAWDESDYAVLQQEYPCLPGGVAPSPTNAPSSLGALAASLQALECRKLLAGGPGHVAIGAQVVLDAAHHRHYLTTIRRNPSCRLADHTPWTIERVPASFISQTLGDLYVEAERRFKDDRLGLQIAGQLFVTQLVCSDCELVKDVLGLFSRLRPNARRCPRCGGRMIAPGFRLAERLDLANLSPRDRRRSLRAIGLSPGDVLSFATADAEVHLEIDVDER